MRGAHGCDRPGTAGWTVGIRDVAFARPDADAFVAGLTAGVTDALVSVFGERVRAGTSVELVVTPEGRMSVGGQVA